MANMPEQKPFRSKQDVGTPRQFLDAVEKRFGKIEFDLAAHKNNKVCDKYFAPKYLTAIYNEDSDTVELMESLILAGGNEYEVKQKLNDAIHRIHNLGESKYKIIVSNNDTAHSGLDSLSQDWTKIKGNKWLNPEFSDIAPWAEKCSKFVLDYKNNAFGGYSDISGAIYLLMPAAVGSNYFKEFIHNKAMVYFLSPRLVFEGQKDPYPKDLLLAEFGLHVGYDCWRWKD